MKFTKILCHKNLELSGIPHTTTFEEFITLYIENFSLMADESMNVSSKEKLNVSSKEKLSICAQCEKGGKETTAQAIVTYLCDFLECKSIDIT